jgi:hypothetical protein
MPRACSSTPTGWSGRLHDQRLLQESPFGKAFADPESSYSQAMMSRQMQLGGWEMPYVLVADSAYQPHPFIIPCFKDSQAAGSPAMSRYNTKVSKTRVVVRGAGLWNVEEPLADPAQAD